MNNLVNAIANETVGSDDRPTAPEKVARYQFVSTPMVELSLAPLLIEDVETEIKEAFEAHGKPYVRDVSLIDDVGERALVEIDLLIRLSNPDSQFNPEWLQEAEESTILAKISNREDLASDFRQQLADSYGISDDIASDLVDVVVNIVSSYEVPILEHYSEE